LTGVRPACNKISSL